MNSEHQTLYRKYRPAAFDQVLGQDHIVKVLQKAVKQNSFSHAYLFSGPRGTGKTTVARIFARAVGASDNDIYEIDAASNRGVDDVKELRESVAGLPLESPYKVYIIDEVHMLSKDAFNALLKTLEEPPRHVIFILATTEAQKLLETVASRCQSFDFKPPTKLVLKDSLLQVARAEGCQLEEAAAELMAILADGSFRDAYGILQKVLTAYPQKEITLAETEEVTSAPSARLVLDFVRALACRETERGMGVLQKAAEQNIDMEVFIRLVLQRVRFILFLKHAPSLHQAVESGVSADELSELQELAEQQTGLTPKLLYELLDILPLIKTSSVPTLPLEVLLVKARQSQGSDGK